VIPAKRESHSVVSTIGGDKIAMSIDVAEMPHIMNLLTDLYEDRQMAVIREYSTNALDSHVDAGVKRPIEVTTPTQLSPFLTIRDYGVGLSPDDIHNIYSKYGASTKRNSNDVVGCLGLGCKAGLTYSDQFTLIGIKDGVRQQVLVSREASGAGSMTVVSTSETTEPNGVTIQIPVKTGNQFEDKARQFFQYWEPGTVLLNGAPPERLKAQKITDSIYLAQGVSRGYGVAKDVVVMGGVPYPVTIDKRGRLNSQASLVVYVPIGAATPMSSREALAETPENAKALERLTSEVYAHLDAAIIKDVDSQPTKVAALAAANTWGQGVRGAHNLKYTWQGQPFPEPYIVQSGETMIMVPASAYTTGSHTMLVRIEPEWWPGTIWITGYSGKWTAPRRKKLMKYAAEQNIQTPSRWVAVPHTTDVFKREINGWIDPTLVIEWSDVNAIKLERDYTAITGAPARLSGSYDLFTEDGDQCEVKANDIRTNVPLYFVRGNAYSAARHRTWIFAKHDKATFVYMQKNRLEKFKRDFPMAIEITEHMRAVAKDWAKKLTPEQQAALAMIDAGWHDEFSQLDPAKLDDPELAANAKLARADVKKLEQERAQLQQYANLSQNGWKNPLTNSNYPLFNSYALSSPLKREHTYLYLNAAFKARVVQSSHQSKGGS
jgi:hypothetical protein